MTASLATADVLKEGFDTDRETIVENKSSLFIFYDLLRPVVVDFRIHTASMMGCIVQDDRLERRERDRETNDADPTNDSDPVNDPDLKGYGTTKTCNGVANSSLLTSWALGDS